MNEPLSDIGSFLVLLPFNALLKYISLSIFVFSIIPYIYHRHILALWLEYLD